MTGFINISQISIVLYKEIAIFSIYGGTRKIVLQNKGNSILVNVSVGSKIQAIVSNEMHNVQTYGHNKDILFSA
jgi:hypothetical protein